ncbi:MAG: hypothetical protein J6Q15_03345 [Clostridia bacterium]|nr:hypothetical protein [Clostridia bacterium]
MKKQRLIALMCAGIITATLTGCSDANTETTNDNKDAFYLYSSAYIGADDVYIVLEQNDTDILHKGNIGALRNTNDYNYSFDCGETTVSNATHALYSEMPKDSHYDEICEDCFEK